MVEVVESTIWCEPDDTSQTQFELPTVEILKNWENRETANVEWNSVAFDYFGVFCKTVPVSSDTLATYCTS